MPSLSVCPPQQLLNAYSILAALGREQLDNSGTPVGYSQRAAFRREKCDLTPEGRNNGAIRDCRKYKSRALQLH